MYKNVTPCPSDVLASSLAAASCYARRGYNVMGGITYFRQKLRIFPYVQYIVGVTDDIVRFKIKLGIEEKCTKNVTPFPMFWQAVT